MAFIQSVFKSAPEIIKEAAQRPLGIVALVILALAVVGFFFFKKDETSIRVCMFVLLLVSFIGLGYSVYRSTPDTDFRPPPNPSPPVSSPTIIPTPNLKVANSSDITVWVNTDSGIYRCSSTTKHGKYMTQKQALDEGYRPAYGKLCQVVVR